ncbi:MAG: hypothetical protein ABI988_20230 [Nitrospirota bacterium]
MVREVGVWRWGFENDGVLRSKERLRLRMGFMRGKKYGSPETTTDSELVLRDAEFNTVVVA